ncbi:PAS domain S-box protein [Emcibacter nanhaiensis]|uniref:histidine kinase n=1 Tax=Emcibacter nanhaiensis TaxID=1505037 RepID=A0A501PPJ5_9PROT|nr:PAS domain S-box protein [Emcibacter nanhaiensis]TPD61716.1 PAS domain S-box protein [Emcibacter nanhaiensis]
MTLDWNILDKESTVLLEIFENSVDAFIALDKDQKITLFNKGAEGIFGYRSEEIVGKKLDVLLPDGVARIHRRHVNAFKTESNPSRMMGDRKVFYGKSKGGGLIPLHIAIQHHNSDQIQFSAICRDISHRMDRERKLSEQKSKFEALFNSSNRLIFLIDEEGRVREANNTAFDILGPDQDCCLGMYIWECAFWKDDIDRARLRRELGTLEGGRFGKLQAKIVSPDGKKISLDISLKKFSIDGYDEKLIVLEAMDVTRLAETNDALRKSERSLARAQQISHLGSWEWDMETDDLYWSDEAFRIFGRTPNAFGASYPAFLESIHPEDRSKVEKAVANAVEYCKPYNIIHRIRTPDGEEKIVHELGEVLRDEMEKPLRMTGTVQDITENWHREKALSEAHSRAEAANRAKSQFLATMSHELRTPLNAIIGFSSSMKDGIFGELDAKYKEYVGYIKDSGEHLLSIINDILDLSRIEVGTIDLRSDWISPSQLLDKSLKYISERAHNKCIKLSVNREEDLPDVYLDERHTGQILINLLTNSVKFTDPGGTIELGARRKGKEIEMFVRDTGIGMSEEDVKKVFQPFVQADMSYARNHEGVGLGLAIVKQLAELQGGHVEIESAPGEGTCVSVSFPMAADREGLPQTAEMQDADR